MCVCVCVYVHMCMCGIYTERDGASLTKQLVDLGEKLQGYLLDWYFNFSRFLTFFQKTIKGKMNGMPTNYRQCVKQNIKKEKNNKIDF